jgi:hypothetical protein
LPDHGFRDGRAEGGGGRRGGRLHFDRLELHGGGLEDEGEDLEVLTYGLDEAFAMIASGEITDSKTIILLQWAMLNRARL